MRSRENAVLKNIGNSMRKCREESGYTLSQAAKELGIADRTLADYERGEHAVRIDQTIKMAELYNTTVRNFIDFKTARGLARRGFKAKNEDEC